ncbi:uncharacterized protein LOC106178750 [Lingula anatina]|uniref:Uncharacterized protein LOC106178750 n=1 Tax=Lingula anatina TaxID=7574 RepID=A0A1S3K511_LINAN|nr:uncharacterized protein LOC106178750 [Lingula anatina]|eukprot:XP_013417509.1 uncharacterized protein LOC106178750 [Lingula anatina]
MMVQWGLFVCLSAVCISAAAAGKVVTADSLFAPRREVGIVTSSQVDEASGLAASRRHPNVLYTHNDHGGKPDVIVLNATTGKRLATWTIRGVQNEDWEDLAMVPCPDNGWCLLIGDIGDQGTNTIYRIKEPDVIRTETLNVDASLKYSWNEDESESLLTDPQGEMYLVTKVDAGQRPKVYNVPKIGWGSPNPVRLSNGVTLPITSVKNGPLGGDISPDGSEILVKTREAVYYWRKQDGDTYENTMRQTPQSLPYTREPQGEAICWSPSGNGYYTLSEGLDQPLYFYARL